MYILTFRKKGLKPLNFVTFLGDCSKFGKISKFVLTWHPVFILAINYYRHKSSVDKSDVPHRYTTHRNHNNNATINSTEAINYFSMHVIQKIVLTIMYRMVKR
jgi:uncharacterized membrane protein